jgi:hypothetical protein
VTEEMAGAPPHVASEFYLWLWFRSDQGDGELVMDDEAGDVTFWVEDRIAFRPAGDARATAVLTGDNPGTSLEARAALAGGKMLRDLKLALRRGEREYEVVLRGPGIEITAAKLPGLLKGGDPAEILYERAYHYEDLHYVLGCLFRAFAAERTCPAWQETTLPAMRAWVSNAVGRGPDASDDSF